jgi:hypothetical protein
LLAAQTVDIEAVVADFKTARQQAGSALIGSKKLKVKAA